MMSNQYEIAQQQAPVNTFGARRDLEHTRDPMRYGFDSETCSNVYQGGLPRIVEYFLHRCRQSDFVAYCESKGLQNVTFHESDSLEAGNPAYDKFMEALMSNTIPDNAMLGVVFHGTAMDNVPVILQNGLDPTRRTRQSYGPGEYFSTDPRTSLSYCKGATEMLVFVVVLPSQMRCTRNHIIVVNNNHHQLPIGTVRFGSNEKHATQKAQDERARLLELSKLAGEARRAAAEARLKAQIMQHLIANQLEAATEVYLTNESQLQDTTKSEISWYVHRKFDIGVLPVIFPGLPKPVSAHDLEKVQVRSLEDLAKDEETSAKRLEQAMNPLNGKDLKDSTAVTAHAHSHEPQASTTVSVIASTTAKKSPATLEGKLVTVAAKHHSHLHKLNTIEFLKASLAEGNPHYASEIYKKMVEAKVPMIMDEKKDIAKLAYRCLGDLKAVTLFFPGLLYQPRRRRSNDQTLQISSNNLDVDPIN